jgi:hypothetical protein
MEQLRDAAPIRWDPSRLHGSFNIASGLWPLIHMRSFEAVTGTKTDKWLVRTVAGLLITVGAEQLRHPVTGQSAAVSRRLGIGAAATAAAIDVFYACTGRISKIYLLDAVIEVWWIRRWLRER